MLTDTSTHPQSVDVPFVYAAVRPSRLRNEARNPYMPSLVVADGDSLYFSVPLLHQFTVRPAPAIVAGVPAPDDYSRSLDPLIQFAALNQRVREASDVGRDTVMQDSGPVACRIVRVTYEPDSSQTGVTPQPRTLWIDERRSLIARDSIELSIVHPQLGHMRSTQETRFTLADLNDGGPDTLYRFRPVPGELRVDRLGAPGLDPPDLSGKPAPEVALATLQGARVSLRALRGRIVVLDFWATWCGPCRRWLPIVARLHRELAAKGVRFYAVNLRETPAQVRSFLAQAKLDVPVLMDRDGAAGMAYGASSIPLTVIVGRDGRIVRTLLGLHPEDDLRSALREAGLAGI